LKKKKFTKEDFIKDMENISKKYDISFIFGYTEPNPDSSYTMIGGIVDNGKINRHTLIDLFEAANRLNQSVREKVKRALGIN
jgi:hypothetical protein